MISIIWGSIMVRVGVRATILIVLAVIFGVLAVFDGILAIQS